jgi:hypothetical protein
MTTGTSGGIDDTSNPGEPQARDPIIPPSLTIMTETSLI